MTPILLSRPFLLFFSSSLLLLLIFHIPTSNAQLQPLYYTCDTTANYTKSRTFATNLNLLLPSISSNSTLNNGFYNGVIGQGPDTVYGQALCRGDATPDVCRDCINNASNTILSVCRSKSAAIWYDYCQLRYSNTGFFGNSTSPLWFYVWNNNNVTDPDPFKKSLVKLMNDLAKRVESEPRLRNFATGEANYTSANSVYGLVQCVPDISGAQCQKCLQDAITIVPKCCDWKIGGRVIGHVCGLRFEISKFFKESKLEGPASSPAPSTAPSSAPSTAPPPAPSSAPSTAPSPAPSTVPTVDSSPSPGTTDTLSPNGTATGTGTKNNSSRAMVLLIRKIVGAIIFSIIVTLI